MKNNSLISITDIVKKRVKKITQKTFQLFPIEKTNLKTKEKVSQSNPKLSLIKVFDKDQIIMSDYIKSFQKPKHSSKIYMSYILGMKNIKEIVGEAKLIEYKHKIRTNYIKPFEKRHIKSHENILTMIHLANKRFSPCGNNSKIIDFNLRPPSIVKNKSSSISFEYSSYS